MGPECALKNNRCFLKSTPCSPSTESYTCTYCTNSKSNAVQRIVLFQHFRWFTWSSILPMPRPYGMPFVSKITGSQVDLLFIDILCIPKWSLPDPRTLRWSLSIHRQPSTVHYIEITCWLWLNNENWLEWLFSPASDIFFRDSTRQTGTAFARLP